MKRLRPPLFIFPVAVASLWLTSHFYGLTIHLELGPVYLGGSLQPGFLNPGAGATEYALTAPPFEGQFLPKELTSVRGTLVGAMNQLFRSYWFHSFKEFGFAEALPFVYLFPISFLPILILRRPV